MTTVPMTSDEMLALRDQVDMLNRKSQFIEVAPLLAVEVLSSDDAMEDVSERIDAFLRANAALVWLADPYNSTVTVYRPGEEPVLFSRSQELVAEPILPGFRVQVAELFA